MIIHGTKIQVEPGVDAEDLVQGDLVEVDAVTVLVCGHCKSQLAIANPPRGAAVTVTCPIESKGTAHLWLIAVPEPPF